MEFYIDLYILYYYIVAIQQLIKKNAYSLSFRFC